MIEFSITEIALFIWGTVATGYALRYKSERRMIATMMRHVIEDVDAYTHMRDSWLTAKKKGENFVKN